MSVNNSVGVSDFNLTPRAKKAYQQAKEAAISRDHTTTNNFHVFLGCLLNAPESFWTHLKLNSINFEVGHFTAILDNCAEDLPELFFSTEEWHKTVKKTMKVAHDLSEDQEQYYIGIEHIICAILETSEDICSYLNESYIDALHLRDIVYLAMQEGYSVTEDEEGGADTDLSSLGLENIDSAHKILSKFSTSMNLSSVSGDLPEIYGRNEEVNQIIEILARKNKCNAILTGETGVGKTAIIEGLVNRILNAEVPIGLLGYEIFLVDIGAMVAGTRYRGEFEERFHAFIKAAESIPNCILFFDEIHNLLGAGGGTDGTLDASNMLKPALARGSIKCIGATTKTEYKKIFEKDAALKRRFQPLNIKEPSLDDMKLMLKNCVGKYEEFHSVIFTEELLDTIIKLCDKYLPNLNFPDKAFDIIDLTGAKVKTKKGKLTKELFEQHKRLTKMVYDNDGVLETGDGSEGGELLKEYMAGMKILYDKQDKKKVKVSLRDVITIVSQKAGVSEESISVEGCVYDFHNKMKKEIFGQDKALEKIDDLLACSKAHMNEDGRPLASFLFVGPTSTGKTFTSKKIAEHFHGNPDSFLHINMGEFMEKGSINKLIGTSSGFIGYEEGGILTDFLSKRPVSVVLFDEIEKAHPKVLDILLSLLDEATVTDNTNQPIDCSKTIFVMTTNIGHAERTAAANQVGFIPESNEAPAETYVKTVKKTLRPELIARIDEIIAFDDLGDEELEKIIKSEINKIREKLKKQGIGFSCGNSVVKFIFNKIKGNKQHARDVAGLVKKQIKVPVSRNLLSREKTSKISVKILDKGAKIHIIGV